jgi:hypothetical protein
MEPHIRDFKSERFFIRKKSSNTCDLVLAGICRTWRAILVTALYAGWRHVVAYLFSANCRVSPRSVIEDSASKFTHLKCGVLTNVFCTEPPSMTPQSLYRLELHLEKVCWRILP